MMHMVALVSLSPSSHGHIFQYMFTGSWQWKTLVSFCSTFDWPLNDILCWNSTLLEFTSSSTLYPILACLRISDLVKIFKPQLLDYDLRFSTHISSFSMNSKEFRTVSFPPTNGSPPRCVNVNIYSSGYLQAMAVMLFNSLDTFECLLKISPILQGCCAFSLALLSREKSALLCKTTSKGYFAQNTVRWKQLFKAQPCLLSRVFF